MIRRSFAPLLVVLSLAFVPCAAHAALYVPTKTADGADGVCDADCSLREAVQAANAHAGEDVILLHAGIYSLTLTGHEDANASGDLDVLDDLTVAGDGADRSIVDGRNNDRVFHVHGGVTAELTDLTLQHGVAPGLGGAVLNAGALTMERCILSGNMSPPGAAGPGSGGALASSGAGSQLTMVASTLTNNDAFAAGGGLLLGGPATLRNVTIDGNDASTDGGGIYVTASAHAVLSNVTIAGNNALGSGGGIAAESTAFLGFAPELSNTIVATNSAPTGPDCAGDLDTSYSLFGNVAGCNGPSAAHHDLVGVDPKLGSLQNDGGTTPVRPLSAGVAGSASPAIDVGNPAAPGSAPRSCERTDQRGVHRPAGAACDIGAYELSAECVPGGVQLCLVGNRFRVRADWETAAGVPVSSGTASAVQLTRDSGYFWFFGPDNVELTVKVLDACSIFHRYWVFASGITDVKVTLTVVDTVTQQTKTYNNPLGHPFTPILDTNAFATCP
jgi:CSLREA domain-containing protein